MVSNYSVKFRGIHTSVAFI